MAAPTSGGKKTMRAVVFSILVTGQRAKHENELRRMGYDVDTRDFPKTYNLNAYDVVFIVKDFVSVGDKENAEHAAKQAGKPWFWLTKKTSNPTWEQARKFAKDHGLTPVEDVDSHEPTFTAKPFAAHLAEYMDHKTDVEEWEEFAKQCELQSKAEKERADSLEAQSKVLEDELRELRKRVQAAAEDSNNVAAQREALRAEVERLQKELAQLTAARTAGRKAMAEDQQRRLADTDKLMREARDERDKVKGELADTKKLVRGLQDQIDKLEKQLAAKPPMVMATSSSSAIPSGKKLVPANIVQTAEKLWSLFEDDVLDIEEAWQKLLQQLKGDDEDG
jgi:hypothetical protein